jgi:hypothetical protein
MQKHPRPFLKLYFSFVILDLGPHLTFYNYN